MDTDTDIDILLKNRGTDADIAAYIYKIEPTRYVYIGDQVWQFTAGGKKSTTNDPKGIAVWDDLQFWIGERLLQRAYYWQTRACAVDTVTDEHYDCSRNAMIFMDIIQRFQKNTYRKQLLEELKIYYVVKN